MIETIELSAAEPDGLRASFAPGANFVLHSLTLGGEELLGQKDGLQAYAERGSTMGIPLLHPWANRLSTFHYGQVELDPGSTLFKRDPNGLPIHGALPSLLRWEVVETAQDQVVGRLDWNPGSPAFELFPFPHTLEYRARLTDASIEIALVLEPTAEEPVPVSFGFHPYLRLPGGSRAGAEITLPVRRRLLLDDSMIPTGESEPFEPGPRPLADSSWDDGFADMAEPAEFRIGDVSLTFLEGYPFAQVFAPPGSDYVCFEPMTAPTNALVRGGPELTLATLGETYRATFAIGTSHNPPGSSG